jgi:HlyD family secretion protein
MNPDGQKQRLKNSMMRNVIFGGLVLAIVLGGAGGWAGTTSLSGAVIAQGTLIVEGRSKKVQHPTGGVVSELLVEEGASVHVGDVIMRVDATVTRANLASVTGKYSQMLARQARLEAELDDLPTVETPVQLINRIEPATAEAVIRRERKLFEDRRAERLGKKERLEEQKLQMNAQVSGLEVQLTAKSEEVNLLDNQMESQRKLVEKGLVPSTRLETLMRETTIARGDKGEIIASIASSKARTAEIGLQLIQVDQEMRTQVAAELRDVQNTLAELSEQKVTALDRLKHVEIRAPSSGIVHQLAIHTVGGVISQAETLMEIVPQNGDLTVEAKIPPQNIDQIHVGQKAAVRLAAFNRNTTPELEGTVIRVSADLDLDEKSGTSYYRVAISIPPTVTSEKTPLELTAGMPVECFIRTKDRTVASYFLKPISDHAQRVFREN